MTRYCDPKADFVRVKFHDEKTTPFCIIEVMNALGAFRNEIVLVGGWVPDLLYPGCFMTNSKPSQNLPAWVSLASRSLRKAFSIHPAHYKPLHASGIPIRPGMSRQAGGRRG